MPKRSTPPPHHPTDPSAPTKEEQEQNDELRRGHPWSLTLSEFLKKVASDYGYEWDSMEVIDPKGTPVHLPYLRHRETGRVVHMPGNLRLEDQLNPLVTASLCRRIQIPPEDFGLLPEEEFEDVS